MTTGDFALAVHAMVCLLRRGGTLSSEALAEAVCTNPARVRRVMARLRCAGLVTTKEGADGGYSCTCAPDQITLRMIADAVEVCFVSAVWRPGQTDMDCLCASGMAEVLDGLYGELDALCRTHLSHITVADLAGRIADSKMS